MAPKKKIAAPKVSSPAFPDIPHGEIAIRAYGFFLQRGCADGWDLDDWLQAERELASEVNKKTGKRKKSQPEQLSVG